MAARTFTIGGKAAARWGGGAALALSAVLVTEQAASAGGALTGSCLGSGRSVMCSIQWGELSGGIPHIIKVPRPATEEELAEARERDRRWADRCQPVIRQDRYGVGRYTYSAAGCEFGRLED